MKKQLKELLLFYKFILIVFLPTLAVFYVGFVLGWTLFDNQKNAELFMYIFSFLVAPMVTMNVVDRFKPFKD